MDQKSKRTFFQHYNLLKNDKTVLELRFNYHTNTARVGM